MADRVGAVTKVLNDFEARIGKKPMCSFKITGEMDEMKRNADLLRCESHVRYSMGLHAATHMDLPIHGHCNGWGLFSRSPDIGSASSTGRNSGALPGSIIFISTGWRNKLSEEGVIDRVGVPVPHSPVRWHQGFPGHAGISSRQSAEQVEDTYKAPARLISFIALAAA
ncbi:hypothetical protein [Phyllobacterium endophyticum]|uniref:Uncharacterized protein n=1 Tax=Phyllobacterium endophyticum TaxID=1149773 RepID=A0A2P7ASJ4_9HYPH|nr:hypothetical protein [Phyllobacterium endophyticum]MBB3236954.1 hypothetical protein [Phyllobacterium endophyticum]PSH57189.1 hypothetical protein CU100_18255 [Phyllobacterium endophyticum]TYR40467.1 hypothetical protein FY050_18260 [Phyllobacterium endophyticum]